MRICAAARRARTRSCSRSCRGELRANKLAALEAGDPDVIVDRQHRLPDASCQRNHSRRCGTGSRCSKSRLRDRRATHERRGADIDAAPTSAIFWRSRPAGWTTTPTATSTTSSTIPTSTRVVNEHLDSRRRSRYPRWTGDRPGGRNVLPLSPAAVISGRRRRRIARREAGQHVGQATRSGCSPRATSDAGGDRAFRSCMGRSRNQSPDARAGQDTCGAGAAAPCLTGPGVQWRRRMPIVPTAPDETSDPA